MVIKFLFLGGSKRKLAKNKREDACHCLSFPFGPDSRVPFTFVFLPRTLSDLLQRPETWVRTGTSVALDKPQVLFGSFARPQMGPTGKTGN